MGPPRLLKFIQIFVNILTLLQIIISPIHGSGNVELELVSILNPNGLTYSLQVPCCDEINNRCPGKCNQTLVICLDNNSRSSECIYGYVHVKLDDKESLHKTQMLSRVTFPFQTWMGDYLLKIKLQRFNGTANLNDYFALKYSLQRFGRISKHSLKGFKKSTRLNIVIKIVCDAGFSGSDCNNKCTQIRGSDSCKLPSPLKPCKEGYITGQCKQFTKNENIIGTLQNNRKLKRQVTEQPSMGLDHFITSTFDIPNQIMFTKEKFVPITDQLNDSNIQDFQNEFNARPVLFTYTIKRSIGRSNGAMDIVTSFVTSTIYQADMNGFLPIIPSMATSSPGVIQNHPISTGSSFDINSHKITPTSVQRDDMSNITASLTSFTPDNRTGYHLYLIDNQQMFNTDNITEALRKLWTLNMTEPDNFILKIYEINHGLFSNKGESVIGVHYSVNINGKSPKDINLSEPTDADISKTLSPFGLQLCHCEGYKTPQLLVLGYVNINDIRVALNPALVKAWTVFKPALACSTCKINIRLGTSELGISANGAQLTVITYAIFVNGSMWLPDESLPTDLVDMSLREQGLILPILTQNRPIVKEEETLSVFLVNSVTFEEKQNIEIALANNLRKSLDSSNISTVIYDIQPYFSEDRGNISKVSFFILLDGNILGGSMVNKSVMLDLERMVEGNYTSCACKPFPIYSLKIFGKFTNDSWPSLENAISDGFKQINFVSSSGIAASQFEIKIIDQRDGIGSKNEVLTELSFMVSINGQNPEDDPSMTPYTYIMSDPSMLQRLNASLNSIGTALCQCSFRPLYKLGVIGNYTNVLHSKLNDALNHAWKTANKDIAWVNVKIEIFNVSVGYLSDEGKPVMLLVYAVDRIQLNQTTDILVKPSATELNNSLIAVGFISCDCQPISMPSFRIPNGMDIPFSQFDQLGNAILDYWMNRSTGLQSCNGNNICKIQTIKMLKIDPTTMQQHAQIQYVITLNGKLWYPPNDIPASDIITLINLVSRDSSENPPTLTGNIFPSSGTLPSEQNVTRLNEGIQLNNIDRNNSLRTVPELPSPPVVKSDNKSTSVSPDLVETLLLNNQSNLLVNISHQGMPNPSTGAHTPLISSNQYQLQLQGQITLENMLKVQQILNSAWSQITGTQPMNVLLVHVNEEEIQDGNYITSIVYEVPKDVKEPSSEKLLETVTHNLEMAGFHICKDCKFRKIYLLKLKDLVPVQKIQASLLDIIQTVFMQQNKDFFSFNKGAKVEADILQTEEHVHQSFPVTAVQYTVTVNGDDAESMGLSLPTEEQMSSDLENYHLLTCNCTSERVYHLYLFDEQHNIDYKKLIDALNNAWLFGNKEDKSIQDDLGWNIEVKSISTGLFSDTNPNMEVIDIIYSVKSNKSQPLLNLLQEPIFPVLMQYLTPLKLIPDIKGKSSGVLFVTGFLDSKMIDASIIKAIKDVWLQYRRDFGCDTCNLTIIPGNPQDRIGINSMHVTTLPYAIIINNTLWTPDSLLPPQALWEDSFKKNQVNFTLYFNIMPPENIAKAFNVYLIGRRAMFNKDRLQGAITAYLSNVYHQPFTVTVYNTEPYIDENGRTITKVSVFISINSQLIDARFPGNTSFNELLQNFQEDDFEVCHCQPFKIYPLFIKGFVLPENWPAISRAVSQAYQDLNKGVPLSIDNIGVKILGEEHGLDNNGQPVTFLNFTLSVNGQGAENVPDVVNPEAFLVDPESEAVLNFTLTTNGWSLCGCEFFRVEELYIYDTGESINQERLQDALNQLWRRSNPESSILDEKVKIIQVQNGFKNVEGKPLINITYAISIATPEKSWYLLQDPNSEEKRSVFQQFGLTPCDCYPVKSHMFVVSGPLSLTTENQATLENNIMKAWMSADEADMTVCQQTNCKVIITNITQEKMPDGTDTSQIYYTILVNNQVYTPKRAHEIPSESLKLALQESGIHNELVFTPSRINNETENKNIISHSSIEKTLFTENREEFTSTLPTTNLVTTEETIFSSGDDFKEKAIHEVNKMIVSTSLNITGNEMDNIHKQPIFSQLNDTSILTGEIPPRNFSLDWSNFGETNNQTSVETPPLITTSPRQPPKQGVNQEVSSLEIKGRLNGTVAQKLIQDLTKIWQNLSGNQAPLKIHLINTEEYVADDGSPVSKVYYVIESQTSIFSGGRFHDKINSELLRTGIETCNGCSLQKIHRLNLIGTINLTESQNKELENSIENAWRIANSDLTNAAVKIQIQKVGSGVGINGEKASLVYYIILINDKYGSSQQLKAPTEDQLHQALGGTEFVPCHCQAEPVRHLYLFDKGKKIDVQKLQRALNETWTTANHDDGGRSHDAEYFIYIRKIATGLFSENGDPVMDIQYLLHLNGSIIDPSLVLEPTDQTMTQQLSSMGFKPCNCVGKPGQLIHFNGAVYLKTKQTALLQALDNTWLQSRPDMLCEGCLVKMVAGYPYSGIGVNNSHTTSLPYAMLVNNKLWTPEFEPQTLIKNLQQNMQPLNLRVYTDPQTPINVDKAFYLYLAGIFTFNQHPLIHKALTSFLMPFFAGQPFTVNVFNSEPYKDELGNHVTKTTFFLLIRNQTLDLHFGDQVITNHLIHNFEQDGIKLCNCSPFRIYPLFVSGKVHQEQWPHISRSLVPGFKQANPTIGVFDVSVNVTDQTQGYGKDSQVATLLLIIISLYGRDPSNFVDVTNPVTLQQTHDPKQMFLNAALVNDSVILCNCDYHQLEHIFIFSTDDVLNERELEKSIYKTWRLNNPEANWLDISIQIRSINGGFVSPERKPLKEVRYTIWTANQLETWYVMQRPTNQQFFEILKDISISLCDCQAQPALVLSLEGVVEIPKDSQTLLEQKLLAEWRSTFQNSDLNSCDSSTDCYVSVTSIEKEHNNHTNSDATNVYYTIQINGHLWNSSMRSLPVSSQSKVLQESGINSSPRILSTNMTKSTISSSIVAFGNNAFISSSLSTLQYNDIFNPPFIIGNTGVRSSILSSNPQGIPTLEIEKETITPFPLFPWEMNPEDISPTSSSTVTSLIIVPFDFNKVEDIDSTQSKVLSPTSSLMKPFQTSTIINEFVNRTLVGGELTGIKHSIEIPGINRTLELEGQLSDNQLEELKNIVEGTYQNITGSVNNVTLTGSQEFMSDNGIPIIKVIYKIANDQEMEPTVNETYYKMLISKLRRGGFKSCNQCGVKKIRNILIQGTIDEEFKPQLSEIIQVAWSAENPVLENGTSQIAVIQANNYETDSSTSASEVQYTITVNDTDPEILNLVEPSFVRLNEVLKEYGQKACDLPCEKTKVKHLYLDNVKNVDYKVLEHTLNNLWLKTNNLPENTENGTSPLMVRIIDLDSSVFSINGQPLLDVQYVIKSKSVTYLVAPNKEQLYHELSTIDLKPCDCLGYPSKKIYFNGYISIPLYNEQIIQALIAAWREFRPELSCPECNLTIVLGNDYLSIGDRKMRSSTIPYTLKMNGSYYHESLDLPLTILNKALRHMVIPVESYQGVTVPINTGKAFTVYLSKHHEFGSQGQISQALNEFLHKMPGDDSLTTQVFNIQPYQDQYQNPISRVDFFILKNGVVQDIHFAPTELQNNLQNFESKDFSLCYCQPFQIYTLIVKNIVKNDSFITLQKILTEFWVDIGGSSAGPVEIRIIRSDPGQVEINDAASFLLLTMSINKNDPQNLTGAIVPTIYGVLDNPSLITKLNNSMIKAGFPICNCEFSPIYNLNLNKPSSGYDMPSLETAIAGAWKGYNKETQWLQAPVKIKSIGQSFSTDKSEILVVKYTHTPLYALRTWYVQSLPSNEEFTASLQSLLLSLCFCDSSMVYSIYIIGSNVNSPDKKQILEQSLGEAFQSLTGSDNLMASIIDNPTAYTNNNQETVYLFHYVLKENGVILDQNITESNSPAEKENIEQILKRNGLIVGNYREGDLTQLAGASKITIKKDQLSKEDETTLIASLKSAWAMTKGVDISTIDIEKISESRFTTSDGDPLLELSFSVHQQNNVLTPSQSDLEQVQKYLMTSSIKDWIYTGEHFDLKDMYVLKYITSQSDKQKLTKALEDSWFLANPGMNGTDKEITVQILKKQHYITSDMQDVTHFLYTISLNNESDPHYSTKLLTPAEEIVNAELAKAGFILCGKNCRAFPAYEFVLNNPTQGINYDLLRQKIKEAWVSSNSDVDETMWDIVVVPTSGSAVNTSGDPVFFVQYALILKQNTPDSIMKILKQPTDDQLNQKLMEQQLSICNCSSSFRHVLKIAIPPDNGLLGTDLKTSIEAAWSSSNQDYLETCDYCNVTAKILLSNNYIGDNGYPVEMVTYVILINDTFPPDARDLTLNEDALRFYYAKENLPFLPYEGKMLIPPEKVHKALIRTGPMTKAIAEHINNALINAWKQANPGYQIGINMLYAEPYVSSFAATEVELSLIGYHVDVKTNNNNDRAPLQKPTNETIESMVLSNGMAPCNCKTYFKVRTVTVNLPLIPKSTSNIQSAFQAAWLAILSDPSVTVEIHILNGTEVAYQKYIEPGSLKWDRAMEISYLVSTNGIDVISDLTIPPSVFNWAFHRTSNITVCSCHTLPTKAYLVKGTVKNSPLIQNNLRIIWTNANNEISPYDVDMNIVNVNTSLFNYHDGYNITRLIVAPSVRNMKPNPLFITNPQQDKITNVLEASGHAECIDCLPVLMSSVVVGKYESTKDKQDLNDAILLAWFEANQDYIDNTSSLHISLSDASTNNDTDLHDEMNSRTEVKYNINLIPQPTGISPDNVPDLETPSSDKIRSKLAQLGSKVETFDDKLVTIKEDNSHLVQSLAGWAIGVIVACIIAAILVVLLTVMLVMRHRKRKKGEISGNKQFNPQKYDKENFSAPAMDNPTFEDDYQSTIID